MSYTVTIKLDATSAPVEKGDAVVAVAGGGPDNTITCKKLNGLLSPGSKWAGVAHTSENPPRRVEVQQVGLVPSSITGLSAIAPPLRSLVRVNRTTGRLERLSGTTPLEKGDLVIGVADQYGNVLLLDHDSGVYDVRDFGAVGDGVTDDAPAFAAAIAAMGGGPGGANGTVLKVPAGTYKCSDDIHVYKQCTILGASASTGNGGTIIEFAAGKSMIFWQLGSPFGGIAQGAAVRDIGIHSTKVIGANDAWAPNTIYSVGAKTLFADGNNNHAYLECIRSVDPHNPAGNGRSGASIAGVPADPDHSAEFVPGKHYHVGQIVRGSTDQQPIAYNGSNLITSVFFTVTKAGKAGDAYPPWDTNLGAETPSGDVKFKASPASHSWLTDGQLVWAAKAHCGLLIYTRIYAQNIYVYNTTNAGIYMRGRASGPQQRNSSGTQITQCRVEECGVGIMSHGSDANVNLITSCDVLSAGAGLPGNGGIGIWDSSQLGDTWISCQVNNAGQDGLPIGRGRSYRCDTGMSVFLGCYSEQAAPGETHLLSSRFLSPCIVIGGDHGALITEDSTATLLFAAGSLYSRRITARTKVSTFGDAYIQLAPMTDGDVLMWQGPNYPGVNRIGLAYSDPLSTGFPHDWWCFAHNGHGGEVSLAIAGEAAQLPDGTLLREYATWIPTRLFLGPKAPSNPPSISYGGEPQNPPTETYARGSIVWNRNAKVGQPIGWMLADIGTGAGEWRPMPNL